MVEEIKQVEIKSATLKDGLCNYSYELLIGSSKGDVVTRKGAHIVHEDLPDAFTKLNVFLAHLDDAYTGYQDTVLISELISEPETENYHVSSFRLSGAEENKSVILSGHKKVSNGYISFDSPKVKLEGDYNYVVELSEALINVVGEVEQYMNGKKQPELEQTVMEFVSSGSVEEFTGAEVQ